MLAVVIAKVGIVVDSVLGHFVLAGLVRGCCNRMLHSGLPQRVRTVCSLLVVVAGLHQVGLLAAEEGFLHEALGAELRKAMRLQKLASFHFFEVVADDLVADIGYGFHFSDLVQCILGSPE